MTADEQPITELAGEPILSKETAALGGTEPLGGMRVKTENGWLAPRPSGTERLHKI